MESGDRVYVPSKKMFGSLISIDRWAAVVRFDTHEFCTIFRPEDVEKIDSGIR